MMNDSETIENNSKAQSEEYHVSNMAQVKEYTITMSGVVTVPFDVELTVHATSNEEAVDLLQVKMNDIRREGWQDMITYYGYDHEVEWYTEMDADDIVNDEKYGGASIREVEGTWEVTFKGIQRFDTKVYVHANTRAEAKQRISEKVAEFLHEGRMVENLDGMHLCKYE